MEIRLKVNGREIPKSFTLEELGLSTEIQEIVMEEAYKFDERTIRQADTYIQAMFNNPGERVIIIDQDRFSNATSRTVISQELYITIINKLVREYSAITNSYIKYGKNPNYWIQYK